MGAGATNPPTNQPTRLARARALLQPPPPPTHTRRLAAAATALSLVLLLLGDAPVVRGMEVAGSPEEVGLASWRLQQITQDLEKLVGQSAIAGKPCVFVSVCLLVAGLGLPSGGPGLTGWVG